MPDLEELREQEQQKQEEVAHRIKEREDAADTMLLDAQRIRDEEAARIGDAQKARVDEAARINDMTDAELEAHTRNLIQEARKKDMARSGVRLTEKGPHDD